MPASQNWVGNGNEKQITMNVLSHSCRMREVNCDEVLSSMCYVMLIRCTGTRIVGAVVEIILFASLTVSTHPPP